jgi:Zn-dependent alcohol dehydrogenase
VQVIGAVLEEVGRPGPFAASKPITVQGLQLDGSGPSETLARIEAAGLSRCTTTWVCEVSAAMDELAAGIAVRQIVRFDGQA